MSLPTSSAHDDQGEIKRAAEQALAQPPIESDPSLRTLRQANVGTPALVTSAEGQPAFWLVPLESGQQVCGYVRVELSHRVSQVSGFGAGPGDSKAWLEGEFFQQPPARFMREIRAKHPNVNLGTPRLSFDGTPAKWAWRIELLDLPGTVAYVAPHGWYFRLSAPAKVAEREG